MPPVPPRSAEFIADITTHIINPLLAIIFAAAFVVFLWGLTMFIIHSDDSAQRTQYKGHMMWGIIGMVIMVSAFSLLSIGLKTFGVQPNEIPDTIQGKLQL